MASDANTWVDPYRNYNFKLVIGSSTVAHFTQVSGLSAEVEAIRYREGGANQVTYRIPGPVTYGDLTLHYGLTSSEELYSWFHSAVDGRVQRKNVSLVLLDADGATEVIRWNFINAWPRSWRGAPLGGLAKEVAVESITLVFETMSRETSTGKAKGGGDGLEG